MSKIFADKNLVIGKISDNIYGSFLEHLGRAVYTGIYEPEHPTADENGFRQDVLELIKDLGVSMVRYPGGNFVSGYDWKDGIGKKEDRKSRLDLGWRCIEPNTFGTDEFIKWCRLTNIQPMLAFNMGTGTQQDALEYFEYCNHPGGTYYSDLRRKNGAEKPHAVKYWCIGNEMDGPWQICGTDADSYGKKALQTAHMIRCADCKDPNDPEAVQLIVCGSSKRELPTYPDWDRLVLEHTYDQVNYLSMHRYYEYMPGGAKPLEDFLCSADDMNEFINAIRATITFVKEKKRSSHQVYISFDEWNIWKENQLDLTPFWRTAPPILEDVYTFRDTIVFAGLMNTLVNNCDIVKVACLAQLVNVIAPIMTVKGGSCYKQGIYYPFAYASANARGEALRTVVTCDNVQGSKRTAKALNVTVTHNADKREVCVFACNYSDKDDVVEMELRSFGKMRCTQFVSLESDDLAITNTAEHSDSIQPIHKEAVTVFEDCKANMPVKAYSWNFLKFEY